MSHAEPDSPAHYYALYLTETARLFAQAAGKVAVEDGAVTICHEDEQAEEVCIGYSDFAVNDDGLLVNFEVDRIALTERLGIGGQQSENRGVTGRIVVAYETARGDLAMLVDLRNDATSPLDPTTYDGSHRTADGRQLPIHGSLLTNDVMTNSSAYDVVIVEATGRGGTLTYVGYLDDFSTRIELSLPVP